jgi:hypothetical protein
MADSKFCECGWYISPAEDSAIVAKWLKISVKAGKG